VTRIGMMSFAHSHSRGYLDVLRRRPDVEVAAADDDPARVPDGVRRFDTYDELLGWAPDGVVVCAETSGHRALTERAASAGAYVLCEKPLATTAADGRSMVDACAAAGVGLMTAFPMRFSAPVAALAAAARAGRVGRIRSMAGTNPGRMPGGWFGDPVLAGGGAVMDHTVHLVDLMRWITGSEPVEVYAQTNRLVHPDAAVETGGLLALTFADGTVATVDSSWSRVDGYPTWGGLTLEVVGDAGVLAVDAFRQYVESYGETTRWLPFGLDPNEGLLGEFLAAIRERRPPVPSGLDGLRATAVALAAYRSAAAGQPVPVAEPPEHLVE
jgi:predicted dehydrogenase